ncbi:MAG: DUF4831 family protein [Bacteroidales bacterium]|nr:DUF4831 family protein [Bacteroidales bacterium]
MKKVIILLGVLGMGLLASSQINVIPITDTSLQIKKNSLVYFLPQSLIHLKLDVKTTKFIPGPFYNFAEKYLSIDDAPKKAYTYSDILGVEFMQVSSVDPLAGFIILDNKASLSFDNRGVITAYNDNIDNQSELNKIQYQNLPEYFNLDSPHYTDYGVKRNFTGITDTTYKVIQLDSVFQKIPVYNTVITSKDFEQKAEEAANYIIKIRKRRFKLQTVQFDDERPPKDLVRLIKQLDKLERQYLELFIGKEISVNNSFYYTFKPEKNHKSGKIEIFHLSEERGICQTAAEDTEPVYLKYKNCQKTKELDNFYKRQTKLKEKEKTKGLYYRIPGHGSICVEFDNHTYAKQTFIIPQYGSLTNLPSKMFKNKQLKIIFDAENGSIKRISNE